ncbi:hypothetical protein [Psychrobacillus sp. BM2]
MKKDTKLGLFLSLVVLIGFPASFAAGFMGVRIAIKQIKKERKSA